MSSGAMKLRTLVDGVPADLPVVPVVGAALPLTPVTVNGVTQPLPQHLADKLSGTLGNGRVPYDFPTIADAAAAIIPVGQRVVRVAGAVVPGTGPSTNVESATQAPGPGRWRSSGPTARYFEPVNAGGLSLEQLGALAGNPAASLTAVQTGTQLAKLLRLDTALTGLSGTTDFNSYMNSSYVGRGSIDLPYKYALDELHLQAQATLAGDLSPMEHCPNSCKARNPIEVLMGDSISTYQANTWSRAGMLATELENELRDQAAASGKTVKFYQFALGGQTYTAADTKPGTPNDRVIPWYQDRNLPWLEVVKGVQPTRVFLSFGMNDLNNISATAVLSVINKIKSWSFAGTNGEVYGTDVVLLTNLVPRPYVGPNLPSNGPWNTQGPQEGADQAAGFIRSLAKWIKGVGLIDMHRFARRSYGGFDPTHLVPVRVRDAVTTTNGATGTKQVYGADCYFRVNPSAFPSNGTGQISIRLGPGDADLFILTKTTVADQYQIVILSGNGGDQIGVAGPLLVTIPPPSDQVFELVCGVLDNYVYLHMAGLTVASGFGEYSQNIWSGNVVKRGGLFTPSVTCNTAGVLSNVNFSYMEPVAVRPTIDLTKLFSPGSNLPGTTAYGGSGYNHPAAWIGAYIYAAVLRGTRLYGGDPLRLTAGQAVRWVTAAGAILGYLATDANGALTFTDGAGKVSPVVGGAWTTYTPTYTATNGGTVTFTPQRTSYEIVGKTLRIEGQFQVTSTSSIAFVDVSLPPGVSLKHGCTGIAANLGNGNATTATGLQGQTALRINGGAAFYGTTGGTIGFNATVEIA